MGARAHRWRRRAAGERSADPGESPSSRRRAFTGSELVGLRYRRPLDVVPLPADRTHARRGAGRLRDGGGRLRAWCTWRRPSAPTTTPAGSEHGLALVRPVAADGTFNGTTWPEIEGKLVTAEETNDLIIRRLKDDGRLARDPRRTSHTYPHCWRCDSQLIYYARDSWFVRTTALKERMLELNAHVNWHPPEVGSGRFGEWLENNVDWALSRDRYWGTPLPVWVCDRDADARRGDRQLRRAGASGRAGRCPADFDPHKPFIDEYTWRRAGAAARCAASPEVIDAWFDSGAMPYAQWHYPFEHEAEFEAHFPADFICEGVDQTRGWFYSLLAIAHDACSTSPAYRQRGRQRAGARRRGPEDVEEPRATSSIRGQMIREFGADAVRLYLLASSQVWLPKRFDAEGIARWRARS